ncbi:MAG: DUF1549 domain-containing protein [Verrucomicrobiae bacterium]|nr:DUF1549 domain-containing protein [Verrucomicrobiae bacterium]
MKLHPTCLFLPLLACSLAVVAEDAKPAMSKKEQAPEAVSYYRDIRPVFQAKCQGCHQPAKAKGDFVMTEVARLIQGGETGVAVVAGAPEKSFLMEQISLVDGKVEMPPKGKADPLDAKELNLVKRWIAEGAKDDTPSNARQQYDQTHPPKYAEPPVVTSLDYSPDGTMIAVAGFHEVLLHKADGSGLVGRLVGLSERVESARFSPDGTRLAVAGGLPGRMGEIQIWDVAKRELKLSVPVGFDTAYGACWSPDGKLVSFGLPDKTVRAIEAETGKQVLFMGGHSDWVLDTAFSIKGDHLVSVGRDMTVKLTNVPTQRFIDNITSITPGALKGGMNAVARHPQRDEILVGGADGVPQNYRMYRETARKIGDNANLIRKFPAMEGRIWSVAYAPDGKRFAAVSSLNGKGWVNIYGMELADTAIPEVVKKAFEKVATQRSPEEVKAVEDYYTKDVKLIQSVAVPDAALFAVAFSPDGRTVAASGDDGQVRFIEAASGKLAKVFVPVQVAAATAVAAVQTPGAVKPVNFKKGKTKPGVDGLPSGSKVTGLEILPASITLGAPNAYNQLLVTAKLEGGGTADVTRQVKWTFDKPVASVEERGLIHPTAEGQATLTAELGGNKVSVSVHVSGMSLAFHPDFVRDVNPVISRLGCNMGTCHGAKAGKNGFKLSLRGYDPLYDVRAFGDDHAARRVNYASPDDSLMLLKTTGAVPHEGGVVTDIGSDYYQTIRQWIADGASLNADSKKVARIELFPKNPVIQNIGGRQQIRVVATYPDGTQADVSREAYIESGNAEVAEHDDFGLITTVRRGEAPILARYEGAYAATTLTVMGNREGFTWKEPEAWTEIDKLVASKWQRMKIAPSELCSDTEFIRRIHLDLTGLPPTPEAVTAFLADSRPTRQKRDAVIDQLVGSPAYVENWTNKWADMLQVNGKFLGREGAQVFRDWIRSQVANNTPYDEFVRAVVTATGSNKDNPAASYYKILRTPQDLVENTTHLFLATRFNCNKCHDHPFEKWNVANYYQTAAYFAQVGLGRDMKNAPTQNLGGTAVEGAKPLYEVVADTKTGDVTNEVTNQVAPPAFPYPAKHEVKAGASRREELAAWLTSPDNQFFATSYVNRIWGYLLGTGIIEPLDDIRAGNPPSNPDLLRHLSQRFVASKFNVQDLMREICKSRTYQLSIQTNDWNEDDTINYSHGKARRLPAEAVYDAVYAVTGSTMNIPGARPGMRAAELADAQIDLPSGFLANLGRPVRESACECERSSDVQLGAVMSMLSGPAVADAVADPNSAISKLVLTETDDKKLIEKIFLRVLNRAPTQAEIDLTLENWSGIEQDFQTLVAQLATKEGEWVPKKTELERQRLLAINKAKGELDAYMPVHLKEKAAAEAKQKQDIAAAEADLKAYEAQIPAKSTAWESKLTLNQLWTRWSPLMAKSVDTGKSGVPATVLPDGSVLASGPVKNVDYAVTCDASVGLVSGFMLEALPHDSLPGFGPGLNENGNFVVSEFEVTLTPAGAKKPQKVKFTNAMADYNQKDFDVKNAINGNPNRDDKAWAVGGGERRPHWARFQLEKPLEVEKGSAITVTVNCRFSNGEYPLGCFRVWTTDATAPLEMGVSAAAATALAVMPSQRNDTQKAATLAEYRKLDLDYWMKRAKVVSTKLPLPGDAKLEALKAGLAKAEQPIIEDPVLLRLRRDVAMSTEQSANRRLTAAQDLTWALLNNAAFLFNH